MHPPTDAEQLILPSIMLTLNLEWNSSSIDHEHEPDAWFHAMDNLLIWITTYLLMTMETTSTPMN